MRPSVGWGLKPALLTVLVASCILAPRVGQASKRIEKVRFAPVYVYLDPAGVPLAAYQFELKATSGQIKIVGVEGGEHAAFKEAPYYDPAALQNERIIIAAFNTGNDLPTTRTRIATIHLQITGDAEPKYVLQLVAAADPNAENLPATITLEKGEQK